MIDEIRQEFISRQPELSWVWDVLVGKQLPETERFAGLSRSQLSSIQTVTEKLRAADRSGSPMALLAVEQLTEKLLSGESVKQDTYFCSSTERGRRTGKTAGITLLVFSALIIFTFIAMMNWNAYLGCGCFIAGIVTLLIGTRRSDRFIKKDLPPHLAETDYHTDRLFFRGGECYLLCDKILFAYCKDDMYPYESRSDIMDYLCVPIADISYIQGQMLILSNGGAITLYSSPQMDDMLEYISALVRWSPAPYAPSKESVRDYMAHDKYAALKVAITVAVLLIGVYSMPSVVSVIQKFF